MKILGIDPGLIQTGYGIINSYNKNLDILDFGTISPNAKEDLSVRLLTIYDDLTSIIDKYNPSPLCPKPFEPKPESSVL